MKKGDFADDAETARYCTPGIKLLFAVENGLGTLPGPF